MINPLLLLEYQDIQPTDFDYKVARICFVVIQKLYSEGATAITPIELDQEIEKHANSYSLYQRENGLDFVKTAYEFAEVNNFELYYNRLKKYSLLRRLVQDGYDVSNYYIADKDVNNPLQEVEIQERFDSATLEDILNSVESKYQIIRNDYLQGGRIHADPSDGIFELIDELQKTPNIGPSLEGKIFSSVCRGAREGCFYLKNSASNVGKALPNNVVIPTPNGFKRVDEIQVGDYLYDAFGMPTKVLGVYPQGKREVWEIEFKDGRVAHCSDEHLWSYCTTGQTYSKRNQRAFKTKTLAEIIQTERLFDNAGYARLLVPINYAVYNEEKTLYPSPYAMGALLGDGSFSYQSNQKALNFSSEDEELVAKVAKELGYNYEKNNSNNYTWTFKLIQPIKTYGAPERKNAWVEEILHNYPQLWQITSKDKFIPEAYLNGSIQQRFDLLNGLLDTDGNVDIHGHVRYFTISAALRDNVIQLCHSLGFVTHIYEDTHKQNITFIIDITGRPEDKNKLFVLSRKRNIMNAWYNSSKRKNYNNFNSIQEIRKTEQIEEMTCFYVDNPEHLFLTEDYIVTHNTRTSVFDACHLAYPIRWSHQQQTFIQELDYQNLPRQPRKVLFIVTEMDKEELQTIILAYLSGVNESNILTGRYDFGELERVQYAASIMKLYQGYFLIEEISDPNLTNIEATIKKYATVDNVKFVFYDYIHVTGSLLTQFRNNVRPDMALMMLANQLKQLAKDYNLFIFSATQVNAVGMDDNGEFKNETSIRDAKSINDKSDMSYVISKVNEKIWNSISADWRKAARAGILDSKFLDDINYRPTHVLDIYKMRRGRYKNVRVWIQLDLGNGARRDLFITNADNTPIATPIDLFSSAVEVPINWRE